jgi:transcriptional regulator with XRE-family HTH domain
LHAVNLAWNASNMAAKRSNEIGATGARVAENVRQLREQRRISTRALAERLAELGRPILATGVTKLEAGQRRVDADDLVALAVALGASPLRLLLPAEDIDGEVPLTPERSAPWAVTWRWAVGEQPLPESGESDEDIDAVWDFMRENRPFDDRHAVMRDVARRVMSGSEPPTPAVSDQPGTAVKWIYEREDSRDGER